MYATKTISVGQLRQNPSRMIRDVREGEFYVLTDRGVPVADIAPHREHQWISGEAVTDALRKLAEEFGPDAGWQESIAEFRDSLEMRDPWETRQENGK